MTTLKLDTLSDRIKAHKNALVHIVKPPVCTERAASVFHKQIINIGELKAYLATQGVEIRIC